VTPGGIRIPKLTASARRTSGNGCSGYPTASARDWKGCKSAQHGKNARPLNEVAALTGYPAPNTTQGGQTSRGGDRKGERLLGGMETLAGYRSPDSHKRGGQYQDPQKVLDRMKAGHQVNLDDQATLSGPTTSSPPSATGKRGGLNPGLSAWLMGFPPEWCACAVTAMPSCRKWRQSS
jgi:hypothetical protein